MFLFHLHLIFFNVCHNSHLHHLPYPKSVPLFRPYRNYKKTYFKILNDKIPCFWQQQKNTRSQKVYAKYSVNMSKWDFGQKYFIIFGFCMNKADWFVSRFPFHFCFIRKFSGKIYAFRTFVLNQKHFTHLNDIVKTHK